MLRQRAVRSYVGTVARSVIGVPVIVADAGVGICQAVQVVVAVGNRAGRVLLSLYKGILSIIRGRE